MQWSEVVEVLWPMTQILRQVGGLPSLPTSSLLKGWTSTPERRDHIQVYDEDHWKTADLRRTLRIAGWTSLVERPTSARTHSLINTTMSAFTSTSRTARRTPCTLNPGKRVSIAAAVRHAMPFANANEGSTLLYVALLPSFAASLFHFSVHKGTKSKLRVPHRPSQARHRQTFNRALYILPCLDLSTAQLRLGLTLVG